MKIVLRIINIILLIIFILLLIINIYLFKILINTPELNLNKLNTIKTTKIFDENDNLIYEFGDKLDYVELKDIHINMINAIISIEDERFYNHNGIDYKALLRALLINIKNQDIKEGASTINQQLVKNIFLTNDKNIERKISEIFLALKLEKYLTKDQILEAYLNNILFGSNIYGIRRASLYYFNKEPSNLEIDEAALLAGIVQLPNYYNPYKNIDESKNRRDIVLNNMYKNNYISEKELNDNLEKEINLDDSFNINLNNDYYSQYISYILEELKLYDLDISQGLNIYTNLNTSLQKEVYNILSNKYNTFPDELLKTGISIIDKNGKILALGGSRNNNLGDLNYATDVKLQPASTIKPLIVYAPIIEKKKYSTATLINDELYYYQNGQKINNWDYKYKGYITLRQALVESRNVPAIKLYNELGMENAHNFIKKMNLDTDEILEAHALGGFKNGFTVLQMTNAYQTFLNNGIFIEGSAIRKIEYGNKTIISKIKEERVISVETSYIINDILKDVAKYSLVSIKGMTLMGKTGQTNYDDNTKIKYNLPQNSTKDSWFIGHNKKIVVGVWTGYDLVSSTTYLDSKKKDIPKDIFKLLMINYNYYDDTFYEMPNTLIKKDIEIYNNEIYLASEFTDYYYKRREIFYKGNEPTTYRGYDKV